MLHRSDRSIAERMVDAQQEEYSGIIKRAAQGENINPQKLRRAYEYYNSETAHAAFDRSFVSAEVWKKLGKMVDEIERK